MPRLLVPAVVMVVGCLSCASPSVRGARSVPPGQEPPGNVATSYVPSDCRDAQGAAVSGPESSRIFLVKDTAGVVTLVESRTGADSLVVHNAFEDGPEAVYQAVVKGPDGRATLRDYRVPRNMGPKGRMAVAVVWNEARGPRGSFRATFDAPAVTCALSSDATPQPPAPAPAAATVPAPAAAPPPAAPPPPAVAPTSTAYGTPEPQTSYTVGQTVAVNRGTAVARAKIVQALTDKYFVEYDTGGSEWVESARVLGRVP